MKIRRAILALAGAVALAAPLALTATAEAAVPTKAITCGMVVQESANLYLPRDLTCPSTALVVGMDSGADDPVYPRISIDLRGHTLKGPGSGFGIWAHSYPGSADVSVSNGVVKGFQYGIAGDSTTKVAGVALVDNEWGYFCNETCKADLLVFKGNDIGMVAAGESSATVTRSTFTGNKVGASVSSIWTLKIDNSLFSLNKVGVRGNYAHPYVTSSAFVGNQTAVEIVTSDPPDTWECADLTKVSFVANKKNLVGPRCTS